MQYIFTGFTHDMGFRVFVFEQVGKDQMHTEFRVRTDLALTRRYGIGLQELPLLCRGILVRRTEDEQERTFTYGEVDMGRYAEVRAAQAAARKKRTPRQARPVEIAWRGHSCSKTE